MPMADFCAELEDVAAKTADVVDDLGERIMAAAYSLVGMLALLLAQAIATGKQKRLSLQLSIGQSINHQSIENSWV